MTVDIVRVWLTDSLWSVSLACARRRSSDRCFRLSLWGKSISDLVSMLSLNYIRHLHTYN